MAFARPTITRAQQVERVRQISVLMAHTESDLERAALAPPVLQQGLEQLGWSEGRNINTSYRWFGGDVARAKAYAKEIVGPQPDAIIANGTVALSAVQHTTKTIPIIFLIVTESCGARIYFEFGASGGATLQGLHRLSMKIGGKWLNSSRKLPQTSAV